jgi:hypothetical protein
LRKLAHAGEFPLGVELPLGLRLPGGGSISQEVRPEDKMATDSQNGDIIALSERTLGYGVPRAKNS